MLRLRAFVQLLVYFGAFKCCLVFLTTTTAAAAAAASFTKRYYSPLGGGGVDENAFIFRLNRSRIHQWHRKCHQQQQQQRHRHRALDRQKKQKTNTSGSRIFWKRPSADQISKHFWDASVPKFNHPGAGKLTDPVFSMTTSTATTTSSSSSASSASTTTSVAKAAGQDSDKCWWPELPLLTMANSSHNNGRILPSSSTITTKKKARSLGRGCCDLIFQYVSANVLSYRMLRYQCRVGEGWDCYQRVRQAALAWEFDAGDKGMMTCVQQQQQQQQPSSQNGIMSRPLDHSSTRSVHPLEGTTAAADRTEGLGRRLVSWTRVAGSVYVFNPVAVLYEWVDQRGKGNAGARTLYTSCAYATQRGHWLAGEERVTVALRETDHSQQPAPVDVEIVSFSRAGPSLLGRLAWPFIGPLQDKFFVEQLRALHRAAAAAAAARPTVQGMHHLHGTPSCRFVNFATSTL